MTGRGSTAGRTGSSPAADAPSPGGAGPLAQAEMFRRVTEETTDLVTRLDRRFRYLYVNRAVERILECPREEIVGRTNRELGFDDTLVSRWERLLARVFETREEESFRFCATIREHEYCFESRLVPECDAHGNVASVLGITRDVTDFMSVGQALRESESKCRTIMEASLAGICVYRDEVFLYVNPAMANLFGYQPDEMIGHMGPLDVVAPEQRELVSQRMDMRNKGEQRRPYELRGLARDGSTPDLIAWGARVELQGQTAAVGTLIDITDRKRAEDQVRRLQMDLAHVSRLTMLDGIAAGLAHEINQPLTAVVNYAEACRNLLGDQLAGEETRVGELLRSVVRQGQRGGEIIRRLRRLARHSSGQRSPVDVNALIRDASQLVDWELRERQIELRLMRERDVEPVMADCVEIQQVVLNLLQNAIRAVEHRRGAREIELGTRRVDKQGHWVEIWVGDNGPGVTREVHQRLLEPFFTTRPGGLGFGLPISSSIIESHGGVLELPEPGPCPVFRCRLPAIRGQGGKVYQRPRRSQ